MTWKARRWTPRAPWFWIPSAPSWPGAASPRTASCPELAARMGGEGPSGHRGPPRTHPARRWRPLPNGTAGVALEMDEGNRLGGGHAAIHVIPAAVAVGGGERGPAGRAFLESVITAYEVTSRIGTGTDSPAGGALARHLGHRGGRPRPRRGCWASPKPRPLTP